MLLQCAGPEVQDMYIVLNKIRAKQEDSIYAVAVKTLNKHLENKLNVPYVDMNVMYSTKSHLFYLKRKRQKNCLLRN